MKANVKHDDVKNGFINLIFVAISVMIQILWLMLLFVRLNNYSTTASIILSILALIVVLAINGKHTSSSVKMPWMVLILTFPLLGMPLYLMLGRSGSTKGMRERFEDIDKKLFPLIRQDDFAIKSLELKDKGIANQSKYLINYAYFPVYNDSKIEYF